MSRRMPLLKLLIAAVLVFDAAAVGAHEITVRRAPRYGAAWRMPHCQVMP